MRYPGWKTLDLVASPEVDYVADCLNLAQFGENSIEALYASHVLEHVPYTDLEATLTEWHRVLMPGGKLIVAVREINIPYSSSDRSQRRGQSPRDANNVRRTNRRYGLPLHRLRSGDLRRASHMAGFEDIRRVPSFSGLPHPGLLWHSDKPECRGKEKGNSACSALNLAQSPSNIFAVDCYGNDNPVAAPEYQ
jgi:SAM-dependent methyltransferase